MARVHPVPVIVSHRSTSLQDSLPTGRSLEGIFVGRDQEMEMLRRGAKEVLAGQGRLVLINGEPGVGKTRTTHELAAYARSRGAQVCVGRCYEGEGAPPFWPWVQIVRAYLHSCDSQRLLKEMEAGAAAIAQVFVEVRERLPDLSIPPPLAPEQARFRFFDSFTAFLKNAAQRQPLVLILDDLHAADSSSLLLLQFVVRELASTSLFIIGAYRDVLFAPQSPLPQALGDLARESEAQFLSLRGFSEQEVARFLASAGLTEAEVSVSSVHKITGGNPFFLTEIVRLSLTQEQSFVLGNSSSADTLPIPHRVREVVRRHLRMLSSTCRSLLTYAAVIGREFGVETLRRSWNPSSPAEKETLQSLPLLEVLDEAIAARLIVPAPQSLGRYSFSHDLVRETLYDSLSLAQRVQLHRQIGEALEELYGVTQDLSSPNVRVDLSPLLGRVLTGLAHHFFAAAQNEDAGQKALHYTTRAGEQALATLAYEEAAGQFARALQVLGLTEPNEPRRCELLLALGDAQRRAGQLTQAKETFLTAAAAARRSQQPQQLAHAALGFAGLWVAVGVVDNAVLTLLEEAFQALEEPDGALRARLCARLGMEFWFAASREQQETLSQQAVQFARRAADPKTLAYCLNAYHLVLCGPHTLEERLMTATEIVHLAEHAGDRELALHGYSWRITDLLQAGNLPEADAAIAAYAQIAEGLRQPAYLWRPMMWRGMRALLAGQCEEGERLAQQALALGQKAQLSYEDAVLGFAIQMFILRREQGRLREMETAVKGFIDQYPAIPALRCALAYLHSEVGDEGEARAEFERLAAQEFTDLPRDMNFPLALAFLAQVCVFLKDVRRAVQLYELLLPYASHNIVISNAIAYYDPVAHPLGLLATLLERWDKAQGHFVAALAMNARLGARPRLAHSQYEYARFLLARHHSGDWGQAAELLDHALATARELGLAELEERIKAQRARIDARELESQVNEAAQEHNREIAGRRLLPDLHQASVSPGLTLFRQEGDYWTIGSHDSAVRCKDALGFHYLFHLLRHPHQEFHVFALIEAVRGNSTAQLVNGHAALGELAVSIAEPGDAGEVLDAQARGAYQRRLAELREELQEAQEFNDLGRAGKVQQERDFLLRQLAGAVGLGGHSRRAASSAERARVSVTLRIKAALRKIAEYDAPLQRYLAMTVKTGLFCSYTPAPQLSLTWQF